MKKLFFCLLGLALWAAPAAAVVTQTSIGNANYTVLSTDQRLVTSAAYTAARTVTLVSAGQTCIGQTCPATTLEIIDAASVVTSVNTMTITPATGETINGSSSSLVLTGAGFRVSLIPTSGSNWQATVFSAGLNTEQAIGTSALTPRNILDNGAMEINTRAATATCATTAGLVALSYSADRWGCDVNVGSGAGQLSVITASPTPPTGFTNALKEVKNSGSLAQPHCTWQEIRSIDAQTLAGQTVTLSAYVAALAGMDNGNAANLVIITGTGADQGMGALRSAVGMTASPAITPAWTGIATLQNTSITLTASFQRFIAPSIAVPATVTEMAVGICWTPAAVAGGATDGLAFTGVQLERGAVATPFEFRPFGPELQRAQRYYYQLLETSAITPIASCTASSVTVAQCLVQFPVSMDITPVAAFTTGFATPTTTAQSTLGACTGLAASTVVASTVLNPLNSLVQCTAATIPAAGSATLLYSNNGSGKITYSADF